MNAPDDHAAEADIDNQIDSIVSICETTNVLSGPPLSEFMLLRVRHFLRRSQADCAVLDKSGNGFFMSRLRESLRDPDAPRRIALYALLCESMTAWKPIIEATVKGDDELETAFALYRFRNLIRDRYPVSSAIQEIAGVIAKKADSGDPEFFRRFGDEVSAVIKHPEKFVRSDKDWMLRGWITLALWKCSSANEVEDLFVKASQALGFSWSSPRSEAEHFRFERAWREVGKGKRSQIGNL